MLVISILTVLWFILHTVGDLAEGKFSRHSDYFDSPHKKYASLANDGNSETCSYTAEVNSLEKRTNPFWRVKLPTKERISELMILTKPEKLDYFEGFEVYVENVTADERKDNKRKYNQKCYRHTGDAPRNESIKVLCENPVVGNQVRIQLKTFRSQLILCDVKINGGRNLAFDRYISQTKSLRHTKPASYAVDGHGEQSTWTECSFTEKLGNLFLKLDIGRNALIWFIRILPYKDIRKNINETLRLQLADDKTNLIEKTADIYEQTWSANITFNTVVARYVTIIKPGESERLQICELKVFGDCLGHECGFDCSKTCHCKYTNIWDKMDGKCSSGCKHGWTGKSCDQCQSGRYGPNCRDTCPSSCNDGVCDNVDGKCQSGCKPGYFGEKCENNCRKGEYGQNCSLKCSDNCNDGNCNNVDGTCVHGCKPGYSGRKCEQECQSGRYEQNCENTCPSSCNDGVCDNVDGKCQSGCKPGYFGEKCENKCHNGKYGKDCTLKCSDNCKNELCSNVDGRCSYGCKPGYSDAKCEQKCQSGRYGQNCRDTCPSRCNDGVCDNVDGKCQSGCKPGYFGEKCENKCHNGTYGQHCANTCSKRCTDGLCDNVDGKCLYGCKPGYVGTKCEQKCEKGMYGDGCGESCGYCLAGAPCDHENGACLDGCVAGYHGQLCKSRCLDGRWGPNCKSVCGHCINSSACSIYTGTCQDECKPGWLPPLCIYAESQVAKDCQSVSIGTIIGPTIAVVGTGAVIIILQLILKRRNSQKPENPVEVNNGTSAPDVNEYETVGPSRVDVEHETQYTELQAYKNGEETVVAAIE